MRPDLSLFVLCFSALLLFSPRVVFAQQTGEEDHHLGGHAPGENIPPKRRLQDKDLVEQTINAIVRGQIDLVKKLVEEGANVNGRDPYSVSLAHMTSIRCKPDILQFLIDKGANVNAQLSNIAGHRAGETPLHFAVSSREKKCVELLLHNGADIALAAREGLTPIHVAAGIGYPEILQMFIDHGADLNVVASNNYGSLPVHLAATSGDLDTMKLLVEHGASVTTPNKLNSTCLHGAAAIGAVDIIALLMKHGADPLLENHEGKTPLQVATSRAKQSVDVKNNLQKITDLLSGVTSGDQTVGFADEEEVDDGSAEL